MARARIGWVEVVLRDHAAERDASEGIDQPQARVEERAAYVLEVDVDAFGTGLAKCREEIARRPVVDGGVGAQLARDVAAFVIGSRRGDHAAAENLANLDHE